MKKNKIFSLEKFFNVKKNKKTVAADSRAVLEIDNFQGIGKRRCQEDSFYVADYNNKSAIDEKGFLGILIGGLKATAGGITTAITCGLIASLLFKAKDKS